MRRRTVLGLAAGALALGAGGALLGRRAGHAPHPASGIDPAAALGDYALEGFERALVPRPFVFPADHGPHPGFRNEWWYFTGNLRDAAGRAFGYQLTLFRIALRPGAPASTSNWTSAWRAHELYMAHLAVSELSAGRFHAREHFARAALDLAGARGDPAEVWSGPVRARHDPAGERWRLEAALGGVGLALTLTPAKPVVLQGEQGLSRKGATPGNASYYYSLTRLSTEGSLQTPAGAVEVSGESWFDREWSTSALEPGQVGWDWFALQFADGRELMYYQLRDGEGRPTPQSAGVLVERDGASRTLGAGDVGLEVLGHWRSPASGVRYPGRWRLREPGSGLTLTVEPALEDQELRLSVRYWEGAVRVLDPAGRPLGQGYVELVGYR